MADFYGVKKPRKSNFSTEEIRVLVETVRAHYRTLYGKFAKRATNRGTRLRAWMDILKKVNGVSVEKRTLQEVKNKWKKYQHVLKEKGLYYDLLDDENIPGVHFLGVAMSSIAGNEDSMPLQDRLVRTPQDKPSTSTSTTGTAGPSSGSTATAPPPPSQQQQQQQQPNLPNQTLKSQPLSPTKLKVTRHQQQQQQQLPQSSTKATPTPPPTTQIKQVLIEQAPSSPINEEMCLRWNSHHSNMQTAFPTLLNKEQYVDCTLTAEGKTLKCHRLILSSCSPYFEEVLNAISPNQHPVLFMRDVPFWILKSLCDFMYAGEVHIFQNKLEELLTVAEVLKIKGLARKSTPTENQPDETSRSHDLPPPPPPPSNSKEDKKKTSHQQQQHHHQQKQHQLLVTTPVSEKYHTTATTTSIKTSSSSASTRNIATAKVIPNSMEARSSPPPASHQDYHNEELLDPLDLLEPLLYEEVAEEKRSSQTSSASVNKVKSVAQAQSQSQQSARSGGGGAAASAKEIKYYQPPTKKSLGRRLRKRKYLDQRDTMALRSKEDPEKYNTKTTTTKTSSSSKSSRNTATANEISNNMEVVSPPPANHQDYHNEELLDPLDLLEPLPYEQVAKQKKPSQSSSVAVNKVKAVAQAQLQSLQTAGGGVTSKEIKFYQPPAKKKSLGRRLRKRKHSEQKDTMALRSKEGPEKYTTTPTTTATTKTSSSSASTRNIATANVITNNMDVIQSPQPATHQDYNNEEPLDPLDLLEPLPYEEVAEEKRSSQSSSAAMSSAKAVAQAQSLQTARGGGGTAAAASKEIKYYQPPAKKSLGRKLRKRKYSEQRDPSPPPVFTYRKGTRSRPNVKIPKYYHSSDFDSNAPRTAEEEERALADAILAATASSSSSTVMVAPSSQSSTINDPLMDVDEIKTEPIDVEDNALSLIDFGNSADETGVVDQSRFDNGAAGVNVGVTEGEPNQHEEQQMLPQQGIIVSTSTVIEAVDHAENDEGVDNSMIIQTEQESGNADDDQDQFKRIPLLQPVISEVRSVEEHEEIEGANTPSGGDITGVIQISNTEMAHEEAEKDNDGRCDGNDVTEKFPETGGDNEETGMTADREDEATIHIGDSGLVIASVHTANALEDEILFNNRPFGDPQTTGSIELDEGNQTPDISTLKLEIATSLTNDEDDERIEQTEANTAMSSDIAADDNAQSLPMSADTDHRVEGADMATLPDEVNDSESVMMDAGIDAEIQGSVISALPDQENNSESVTMDAGIDAEIEETDIATLPDEGINTESVMMDNGSDDLVEGADIATLPDEGNNTESVMMDSGADGIVEGADIATLPDEGNNMESEMMDSGADGIVEGADIATLPDEGNNMESEMMDSGADGIVEGADIAALPDEGNNTESVMMDTSAYDKIEETYIATLPDDGNIELQPAVESMVDQGVVDIAVLNVAAVDVSSTHQESEFSENDVLVPVISTVESISNFELSSLPVAEPQDLQDQMEGLESQSNMATSTTDEGIFNPEESVAQPEIPDQDILDETPADDGDVQDVQPELTDISEPNVGDDTILGELPTSSCLDDLPRDDINQDSNDVITSSLDHLEKEAMNVANALLMESNNSQASTSAGQPQQQQPTMMD